MKSAITKESLDRLDSSIYLVEEEVKSAMNKHQAFTSPHEGYAIILEEVDELWDEVKLNPKTRSLTRMRDEAIQVAAMAVRFLIDFPNKTESVN